MKKINRAVFLVQHVAREGHLDEDTKLIGAFSTRAVAEAQVELYKRKPGFSRFKKGFYISELILDEPSWAEGFFTVKNGKNSDR